MEQKREIGDKPKQREWKLIGSKLIFQRAIGMVLVLLLMILSMPGKSAEAVVPYWTNSMNASGDWIDTPNAFVPDTVWRGFKDPEDLFITKNDEIYVADSGNDRIVQLDTTGKIVRTIPAEAKDDADQKSRNPKEKLRGPEGVFVADDGTIYIADTNSRRVAVFDKNGQYVKEYMDPKSPLIPSTFTYVPSKVVLDKRGYLYISTKGGYQGLMQLTPDGQFAGFFGANKVTTDWITAFKRKFYTEDQLRKEIAQQPGAVTNVTADSRGFLYTVNENLPQGQLRRLNFGGVDLLNNLNFAPWNPKRNNFSFKDVFVDDDEIMTVLEEDRGRIYQYDKFGKMIFRFGNQSVSSQRLGLFKRATSLVVTHKGTIIVSDGELGVIQTFKRTPFGSLVHTAVADYTAGKYEESRKPWTEVLQLDGLFDRSYQGIAKAEYKQGDYAQAIHNFELARDKTGYSNSFWELRMDWLLSYFGIGMSIIIGLAALWVIYRTVRAQIARRRAKLLMRIEDPDEAFHGLHLREDSGETIEEIQFTGINPFTGLIHTKTKNRWMISLQRLFSIITHPINTLTDIVERGQVRFWFAALLIILAFIISMAGKAVISYLFTNTVYARIDFKHEAEFFFLPWLTWVAANYLVGSVMKGEGTWARVFIVNAYAMAPFILFNLPIKIISNLLTQQEGVIFSFVTTAIMAWVLILMFLGTQAVHNYNLKEALGMVSVSVFTLGCIWLFGFVLIGLIYQSIDFFMQWGQELVNRV